MRKDAAARTYCYTVKLQLTHEEPSIEATLLKANDFASIIKAPAQGVFNATPHHVRVFAAFWITATDSYFF